MTKRKSIDQIYSEVKQDSYKRSHNSDLLLPEQEMSSQDTGRYLYSQDREQNPHIIGSLESTNWGEGNDTGANSILQQLIGAHYSFRQLGDTESRNLISQSKSDGLSIGLSPALVEHLDHLAADIVKSYPIE